jgi:hypothetical protein
VKVEAVVPAEYLRCQCCGGWLAWWNKSGYCSRTLACDAARVAHNRRTGGRSGPAGRGGE